MNSNMKSASINAVMANGQTATMWSTTDHANRSAEVLLQQAIKAKKVIVPGVYMVIWNNMNGMPTGRLYTLDRNAAEDKLVIHQGVQVSTRVNRWPPSA